MFSGTLYQALLTLLTSRSLWRRRPRTRCSPSCLAYPQQTRITSTSRMPSWTNLQMTNRRLGSHGGWRSLLTKDITRHSGQHSYARPSLRLGMTTNCCYDEAPLHQQVCIYVLYPRDTTDLALQLRHLLKHRKRWKYRHSFPRHPTYIRRC